MYNSSKYVRTPGSSSYTVSVFDIFWDTKERHKRQFGNSLADNQYCYNEKVNYRKFGRLGWKVSALGFGAMRLPVVDEDKSKINETEAIKMIRWAIDGGVNYLDTAYPYHEQMSEVLIGKALQDGYRQKVKLATKLPVWAVTKAEDFDSLLDEQLRKLKTDWVDFYLLHALDRQKWETVKKLNILDKAKAAIEDGRIKYLGFSFHDDISLFKEIVDAYDWTFCQIQLNILDGDFQAGLKGMRYAAKKGLAVVIMEPLKGGKLANPPLRVLNMWKEVGVKPVDGALQWLWNMKEVSLLLSGMSNLVQVKENIKSAEKSKIGIYNKKQLEIIKKIRVVYEKYQPIACTNCKYCMPCPSGVDIPKVFEIYNGIGAYYKKGEAKKLYNKLKIEERASNCIGCGKCEKLCPQGIEIMDWLSKIDKDIGG